MPWGDYPISPQRLSACRAPKAGGVLVGARRGLREIVFMLRFFFSVAACLVLANCANNLGGQPRTTVAAYAAAIRSGDSEGALRLLDKPTRAKLTKAEYGRRWTERRAELRDQASKLEQVTPGKVEIAAELHLNGGYAVEMVFDEGRWHLAGGLPSMGPDTPRAAVLALLQGLENRDPQAIYGLLAKRLSTNVDKDIRRRAEGLRAALRRAIVVRDGRAYVRAGAQKLVLIKERGRWKVYDFD